MTGRDIRMLLRVIVVAIIALGIWALARYGTAMPPPLSGDAPATEFSAARAEAVLARILGPERPHPVSTDENVAVRARVLREYATLGVPTKTYRALGCRLNRNFGALACATVTDIVADVRGGRGKAIVMLSHYDSVPAGPGASDDESGTASILESVRALKAANSSGLHPIVALNTDGEEFGLLGAAAFLDNPELKSHVGAVVNVEARGNKGPSLLFQTSPGDGPLIDLYAKSLHTYATSSLFAVIYRLLPNDTDLTLFIQDGFLSWNFAFSDNVAHYHTPFDLRRNLDPATLQMQGENMLGMVDGLESVSFDSLKGSDAIYVSLFGRWLPRLHAIWALPLSLVGLIVLGFLGWLRRERNVGVGSWLAAFAILPVLLIGSALAGLLLHTLASLVSGHADPSFAFPALLRLSLALGVLAVTVASARIAGSQLSVYAIWIWCAVLSLLTAVTLTGLSPYFLFPLLVAIPVLVLQALLKLDLQKPAGRIAVFLSALPALLVWISLVASGETIRGLFVHPVFTVPAAMGLATLVPLIDARAASRNIWLIACGVLGAASLGTAVLAGFQPAFSAVAPQRLNIDYVEDAVQHKNFWSADATAPLPDSLRAAAAFSPRAERPFPFSYNDAYVAQAGVSRFSPPTAEVKVAELPAGTRLVSLALRGSSAANQMVIAVPKYAGLKSIDIGGKHFGLLAEWARSPLPYNIIGCFSRDCATRTIALELAARRTVRILLGEVRFGLPPDVKRLLAARPKTAVASQNGDTTILLNGVTIPAG